MAFSPRRQLHKYPNAYLVETGSCRGDGVQDGLNCGFKHIISMEVMEHLYRYCRSRFASTPQVRLIHGSSLQLGSVIGDIQEPITFWLDAHWSGGETGFDQVYCPILQELAAIRAHPIKTHTILIDDRRLFGTAEFNHIREDQVINVLREINPAYIIRYEDGHVPADILVAVPP